MNRTDAGVLRIATRESPLALWQAEHVRDRLLAAHPGLRVELVPMTTTGDQLLSGPLSASGGKGLFVKELEQALLEDQADLAVHSMKDVPAHQPDRLAMVCFLRGEDPRDAFVSNSYRTLDALPHGARVGTSSLRRQALLRRQRPDLQVGLLRGNVGTRLRKLDEGQFEGILLACAGLIRLGLGERIAEHLDVERFIPAIGQGIVGIECRTDDRATQARLAILDDPVSGVRLAAERALNRRLGGACQVPIAGHAVVNGDRFHLRAMVGAPDGSRQVRDQIEGHAGEAAALGVALAERLLDRGAREILGTLGIAA